MLYQQNSFEIELSTTTSYWASTYNTTTLAESGRVQVSVTVNETPPAPTVEVVDNCDGTSTLTASDYTGSLLWSTNETTASITVTTAGTYTVTQTVDGCPSAAGSSTAAPKTTPDAPVVTVIDNCNGTSTLTASNYTGSLLWSTGETDATITVTAAGTFTVTQTVDGCESEEGEGTATPRTSPAEPTTNIRASLTYYTGENSVTLTGSPSGGVFTMDGNTFNGTLSLCNATPGQRTIRYTYTDPSTGCSSFKEYEITIKQSKYTIIVTSNQFPVCRGENVEYTAHVYRDVEVIYPYKVNANGQPIDNNGNLVGLTGRPVLNPDYLLYLPENTPQIMINSAWRFFPPIVVMGDGVKINTADITRAQSSGGSTNSNNFTYQWYRNGNALGNQNTRGAILSGNASLSSTDVITVQVAPRSNNNITACPTMQSTFSSRIFLVHLKTIL